MAIGNTGRTADAGRTVRQRIIDAFDTIVETMTDGGQSVFLEHHHGDLDSLDNVAIPAVSIDVGTEEKISMLNGCTEYDLPVFFHFRFRGKRGLDELDVFHYYLGLVQTAVLADHNLGGLTINIEEDSNAHTIIGIEDAIPGGTLATIVTYRTRLHNPYKLPTEAP
jgi:hypothetical protein